MVRINAIELIDRFIVEQSVRPMKNWSLRNTQTKYPRYSEFKRMAEKIRNLLNLLSGNDILAMLKSRIKFYFRILSQNF